MKDKYFDEPKYNAAFIRCVDVLAELIEKYAGSFTLWNIDYEYYLLPVMTSILSPVFSFENNKNRFIGYIDHGCLNRKRVKTKCQKAS